MASADTPSPPLQDIMATTNDHQVADKHNNEEMIPEKGTSSDLTGEGNNSNRLHRFDMVLQHLHLLKSQMNNNLFASSAATSTASSESPPSPSANKNLNETKSATNEGNSRPSSSCGGGGSNYESCLPLQRCARPHRCPSSFFFQT